MKVRIACCLLMTGLGLVASASAQNYDYFLPRHASWYDGRPYPMPAQVRYGNTPCHCQREDDWMARSAYYQSANYTYPQGWSPNYSGAAYAGPAYAPCGTAPVAAAPYPGSPMSYTNGEYYVGYGLYGQPRAFARDEPVRNFFRFLLP